MKQIIIPLLACAVLSNAVFAGADAKGKEWQEYKQVHFIIYYKDAPLDFVKTVESSAEQYYDEIAQNLGFTRYEGWTFDDRAKIYIYDDEESYMKEANQAKWSHGVASPKDRVIRTYPMAQGFFDTLLPHELGHIIFREFVGFKVQVPLWFEEGIAMYQEKARRFGVDKEVKQAMLNKEFMPLEEMTFMKLTPQTDEQVVLLFYSESASIVNYMINELGKERFVIFCRKLKESNSFDEALKYAYVRFAGIKELNKTWVDFLAK